MSYVDGYVIAVPTNNREAFIKHAKEVAAVFKDHGASRVVECWGEDVPDGKVTSFPMAVKPKFLKRSRIFHCFSIACDEKWKNDTVYISA